jgi:hypothetical protein
VQILIIEVCVDVCVYSTIVCSVIYIKAKKLIVTEILILRKKLIYRCAYVMFRALELITLDLLCLYSNAMPQYLEQTMRYDQPVGVGHTPSMTETDFPAHQAGSLRDFDHLDLFSFLMPNFKRR